MRQLSPALVQPLIRILLVLLGLFNSFLTHFTMLIVPTFKLPLELIAASLSKYYLDTI